MRRYIDADKLLRNLPDDLPYKASVKRVLIQAPEADVVPKSEVAKEFTCFVGDPHKVDHCPYLDEIETAKTEVERLERILFSCVLQYGTVKDQQAVIDKVKAEAAREIFEELEKFCRPPMPECQPLCIMREREFAELKKKYIKDCTTCKHLVSCEPNTSRKFDCWEAGTKNVKKYTGVEE